ncbi:unnamed protein product [Cuscuta europaea]|uniref:Pentatricopeptide repeat-containing protein n=1 Tax=Cuscuta europaea TaxID=41803 RepID=A0A9P0ZY91_CUSEU|nr:unnamed protein product [Cuscuta europaea]
MVKYRSLPHWSLQPRPLLFFSRKVPFSTSPLPIEHPPISAATTQAFPHEIKATCFSELEQLIRHGLISLAEKLVQNIVRHSSSVHEAVSAVDFALSRGVELDRKSYGFLIRKLLTCGEAKMAEAVYVDFILNRGIEPDHFLLNSMVVCYSKLGKLDAAELCMDKMSTLSLQPSLLAYNSMIWCLCQMGLGNDAISILDQMEATRVKPTVALYDYIIRCLAREKRVLEASKLFDRMHEVGLFPDETVYVTMISGLSKNRQAGAARELFDKMFKYGIRPSHRAYTALINGLVKQNMIQEGHIYLGRMLEDGFMPNAALYTSLIYQFFRKGEIRFALKLVVLMEKSHIKKDVVTHVALVNGVCRNIQYISRKCHKSQRSSIKAMEMLYHLLCEYTNLPGQKDLENFIISRVGIKAFALKLIGEVKKGYFIPNLYLHNSVIAGLCWANDMEGAYNHLDAMQKQGLLPNHVTLTILIDGHFRKGIL